MRKEQKGPKWNLFFYHLLIFVCVHVLLIPIAGLIPLSVLGSDSYLDVIAENFLNHGVNIYENSAVNTMSGIWKTVLIIHLILDVIEYFFPTKKNRSAAEEIKTAKVTRTVDASQKSEKESTGKAWIQLMIAGLLEIVWAAALKMEMLAGPVIIVLIISFDLLIKSVKRLGVGTAYAVFTGIGVVGMVMVDTFFFQEPLGVLKILLIFLLVIFIIGLKISSDQQEVR